MPNLENKTNYILHFDNLLFYLEKGMKLKKIHRAISYFQDKWLEPYIQLNTKLRQEANNDFKKHYYKLMNNSFYGKTMENVRDYIDIKFATNEKNFIKNMDSPLVAAKPIIIKENGLALIKHKKKKSISLDKPLYVGSVILEN